MDRGERTGLGIATAGHIVLFGALSVGLLSHSKPLPPMNDPMEVQLTDEIGMRSAMPQPAVEPPAPSEAPVQGPPTAAAPAEPTPAPPKPEPEPLPPPPTPAPTPQAKAKPTPAKETLDTRDRRRPDRQSRLSPDMLKGLKDPKGSRLGPDFLKGISAEKTGKASTPRAATVDARAMAGLAAAIAAQVKPCYVVPSGGTDSGNIVTVLRLRFKPDGSTATPPAIVEQNGVGDSNRAYAQQMGDAAKRAVLRCSPLRLPAELYKGGWEDIEFVFNPRMMG
jgi:outer membrane biosynthesis protein TonB